MPVPTLGAARLLLLSRGKESVLAFFYARSRYPGLVASRLGTAAALTARQDERPSADKGTAFSLPADRVAPPLFQSQAKETDP